MQIALGRRVAVAARLLDELLGVIVDGPAVAAARGVDVNRTGIDEVAMLGGKGYLIMNRLAVVGKLDGRVVDAVELPEHLQRAGLAPGEVVGENPRQTLECSPSQGAEEASYAFLVPESSWPPSPFPGTRKWLAPGRPLWERTGPSALWYLGNVDGPCPESLISPRF